METYSAYNVQIVLFAAFGSLLGGYGLAVIIATVGQPSFYESLGLQSDPTAPDYAYTNTIISTAQGIFFAGGFFGCAFISIAGSRFGRIRGFQAAAVVGIIGSAIQTGAISPAMYIVARFITGVATGQTIAALPIYFAEVSPPHSRGLLAGAHGCFINVGYAAANWIGFGSYFSKSSFAWRFPNAVLLLWALCFLAGTFIIPESPRWLVIKGREQEALAILRRLHHDPRDAEDSFAHQELRGIHEQIEVEERINQANGKWQIFTVKTYRNRLILACMVIAGTQNTGVLVINGYNALLYQSLGLSNTQALIVSAAYNTFAMIANFIGATFSDRFGRRKLMLIGFTSTVIMFIIATGLVGQYNQTKTKELAAASVAMFFLYVFCYACFIDVNCWTVATEVFPTHLRSQGAGIAMSFLMSADLLWLQLSGTATATIGWKYYIVFIALTFVHIIHLWFRLPETSGVSLEDMDALFGGSPEVHSDADHNSTATKPNVSEIELEPKA
ncbi:general substrate transporter [Coniochaeta ligniaria NRRL 30616]|uniref:General substrate transporter n=1 Tax=Coniochaeta ligniaria NRRL 30616 TaxID=1408157 RepID=A0A1J7IYJ8_9PEZI|nr:general substrate transporter [Coniochaeta ligniaria NRRL 30616]